MPPRARDGLIAAALAAALAGSHAGLVRSYAPPFPPLESLAVGEQGLQDIGLVVSGFRRAAADLAWIQYLQVLGSPRGAEAARVREGALRVARLDPRFTEAFVYGAGLLAFSELDRPEEAIALLREGIASNPGDWQLTATLAAIVYKRQARTEAMFGELQRMALRPDAPALIRGILGNLFKRNGQYAESLAMWELILASDANPGEKERAQRRIREIRRILDP